jgi:hypothetical protein
MRFQFHVLDWFAMVWLDAVVRGRGAAGVCGVHIPDSLLSWGRSERHGVSDTDPCGRGDAVAD